MFNYNDMRDSFRDELQPITTFQWGLCNSHFEIQRYFKSKYPNGVLDKWNFSST